MKNFLLFMFLGAWGSLGQGCWAVSSHLQVVSDYDDVHPSLQIVEGSNSVSEEGDRIIINIPAFIFPTLILNESTQSFQYNKINIHYSLLHEEEDSVPFWPPSHSKSCYIAEIIPKESDYSFETSPCSECSQAKGYKSITIQPQCTNHETRTFSALLKFSCSKNEFKPGENYKLYIHSNSSTSRYNLKQLHSLYGLDLVLGVSFIFLFLTLTQISTN